MNPRGGKVIPFIPFGFHFPSFTYSTFPLAQIFSGIKVKGPNSFLKFPLLFRTHSSFSLNMQGVFSVKAFFFTAVPFLIDFNVPFLLLLTVSPGFNNDLLGNPLFPPCNVCPLPDQFFFLYAKPFQGRIAVLQGSFPPPTISHLFLCCSLI